MTSSALEPAVPATARPAGAQVPLLLLLVGSPMMIVAYQTPYLHPALWLLVLFAASHLLLRREGLSLATLGLRRSWRTLGDFLGGFAGGAVLVLVTVLALRLALPFPWAFNPRFHPVVAAGSLYYLFLLNSAEELVFRGYSFVGLLRTYGQWPAQLLTAVVFAMFHVASGWPWQVALIGTTAGSLLFALVFLRWQSLPAAAGVHLACNWVRDLLFMDPARPTSVYGPVAPRPWTGAEQLLSLGTFTGIVLLACAALVVGRRRGG